MVIKPRGEGTSAPPPPKKKKTALLFMGPICKGKDFAFQT